MSKIGKKPIEIPPDVEVKIKEGKIFVQGPKGKLEKQLHPSVEVEIKDNKIFVRVKGKKKKEKALWGTFRQLIFNLVEGVKKGFEKKLLVEGVGYKCKLEGKELILQVGFSHPVKVSPPEGIEFLVDGNQITVLGIDKELVGQVAAKIRAIRPPEPYKGKGIRYFDEKIRRKVGKKTALAK